VTQLNMRISGTPVVAEQATYYRSLKARCPEGFKLLLKSTSTLTHLHLQYEQQATNI